MLIDNKLPPAVSFVSYEQVVFIRRGYQKTFEFDFLVIFYALLVTWRPKNVRLLDLKKKIVYFVVCIVEVYWWLTWIMLPLDQML